jgi:hypothetical protein
MKAPVRLREATDSSDEMRDLLASARRPRPMTAEQHQLSARRARAILAAPPVALALGFWTKAVALAAMVSVGAVTAAVTLLPARGVEPKPAASSAQPARRARGATGTRTAPEAQDAPEDSAAPPAAAPPAGEPASPASPLPERSATPGAPGAPAAATATPTAAATMPTAGASPTATAAAAKLAGDHRAGALVTPVTSVTPGAAPTISADDLAREASLLESARASVATAPAAALAALDEHARRFPRGQLAAERELLRVDALTRLGQRGDAAARGRDLMNRDDGKLYEGRVRTLLDAPDASAP